MALGGSLDQNPPNADRHITAGGTDWAWAVFAVMLVSDFLMIAWTFVRARGTRLFHQIAVIILTTAAIAYFSMGSDLGAAPAVAEFSRGNTFQRQIWFVRYIQYFINFPLILLLLLLLTGLAWSDIFTTLFMSWVVVVTGLVGALVPSSYKWGYFAIGIFAIFYIWYAMLVHAPLSTFASATGLRARYFMGAAYISFFLIIYPIAWACSEGANTISPTGEFIWYGILDVLTAPVFLFLLLLSISRYDYGTFGLLSTKYSESMSAQGPSTMREKPGAPSRAPGPTPASPAMASTNPPTAPTNPSNTAPGNPVGHDV